MKKQHGTTETNDENIQLCAEAVCEVRNTERKEERVTYPFMGCSEGSLLRTITVMGQLQDYSFVPSEFKNRLYR